MTYKLYDTHCNDGGFCCIPGSHKAGLGLPAAWRPLSEVAVQADDIGVALQEDLMGGEGGVAPLHAAPSPPSAAPCARAAAGRRADL